MNNETAVMIEAFAVPGLVLFLGAVAACRAAKLSPGWRRRVGAFAVVLALAVSATVSVIAIPTKMEGIRPENPYPAGLEAWS